MNETHPGLPSDDAVPAIPAPSASSDDTEKDATTPPLLPANEVAIDIRNISHRFRNHLAVDRVTFQVASGSLHGFVGPNGAGKTTVLKLICTLLQPQSGAVRVFDKDVLASTKAVRRQIGFMPDHFSMYRRMTVTEYLDFFAAAYGLNLADRRRVIGDVLALTDMDGRRDSLIASS